MPEVFPEAGRSRATSSDRGRVLSVLVGLGVFLADQITKGWAQRLPSQAAGGSLIPHLLRIFPVGNPGIAFSLFAGMGASWRMAFAALSALTLVLVTWMVLRRPVSRRSLVAMALVLGGAGGNLMDRLLFGRVTDFLLITLGRMDGPIFNLADTAITIGAFLLIWDILRTGPAILPRQGPPAPAAFPPAAEWDGIAGSGSRSGSVPRNYP